MAIRSAEKKKKEKKIKGRHAASQEAPQEVNAESSAGKHGKHKFRKERKLQKERNVHKEGKTHKKLRLHKDPESPRETGRRFKSSAAENDNSNAVVFGADTDQTSFGVTIRSSEPIMRAAEEKEEKLWLKELPLDLTCAAVIVAFISLFLAAADYAELIPFALAGAVVFLGVTITGSLKPGLARWITAGVIGAILIISLIIWHTAIGGGLAIVVNSFYDVAEEAQAYLYNRFEIADYASDSDSIIGVIWASSMLGLLLSLIPASFRPYAALLPFLTAAFAFAYYGLIPSWICVAVLLAAMIPAISKNNSLASLAVVLGVLIVFGLVVFIDPGEITGISVADENIRDRLAFKSAQIEDPWADYEDPDYLDAFDQSENELTEDKESIFEGEYGSYYIVGTIAIIVLAIAAAAFVLWRRFKKRRDEMRAGLDSSDTREAVTAMFPYSVRWLKCYGVDMPEPAFTSLIPGVRAEFSNDYAKRFLKMYGLWSEAAYSDHEISSDDRRDMERFMMDTVNMIEDKCGFRDKLKLKVKYAL